MFAITHDIWTHPDQSSRPKLQRVRAADASSLAHQIANNSPHGLYRSCGAWQPQLRVSAISSEMFGPPQKLADRHAHDARAHGLLNELLQALKHLVQSCTVREFQHLAGKPVKDLSHRPTYQFALSSASAALQLADEMKMAQLHDPGLPRRQPYHPPNVVGYRGAYASVYWCGNRRECLRPAAQILPLRQEHRIEEHRSILMARLHTHQIQDPMASAKPKVQSVQYEDQRSCGQAHSARSRHELLQGSTKTVPQRLTRKAGARREAFQRPSFDQDSFQKTGRSSPALAASLFAANSPCTLAMAALTTSRTEAMDFGSATGRFHVRRIHARELSAH